MLDFISLIGFFRFPQIFSPKKEGFCFACGRYSSFRDGEVISDSLSKEWEIDEKTRHAFDLRESLLCSHCGNSLRARQLARALAEVFGKGKVSSLNELVELGSFKKINAAEINSCGNLHQFLEKLPNLCYSEFQIGKKIPGVRHEDLHKLSYKDGAFDLVITSDTLEHIPNIQKALTEIYRVLKPSGYHIFTIPVIVSRKTRDRILVGGQGIQTKVLPDSFHGGGQKDNLVFREFGFDVVKLLTRFKFKVNIYYYNFLRDDYSFVFVCQK